MTPEAIPLNYLLDRLNLSATPGHSHPHVQKVGGGSINHCYKLSLDQASFFIKANKLSQYPGMFDAERDGLESLRSTGIFRIPKVLDITEHEDQAFMILEYVVEGIKNSDFWSDFGQRLAKLHLHSNEEYGYPKDNYIGSLQQANRINLKWSDFFVEQRLEPQIRLAKNLLSSSDRKDFDKLFYRLDRLVPEERPSLLHGDLWLGNYLVDDAGKPVLIDPAVYYGHREMDLGMMHLFGGFAPEVYDHYQKVNPLQPDWAERLDLHNLYPLLVHLNLFGQSYLKGIQQSLRKYL